MPTFCAVSLFAFFVCRHRKPGPGKIAPHSQPYTYVLFVLYMIFVYNGYVLYVRGSIRVGARSYRKVETRFLPQKAIRKSNLYWRNSIGGREFMFHSCKTAILKTPYNLFNLASCIGFELKYISFSGFRRARNDGNGNGSEWWKNNLELISFGDRANVYLRWLIAHVIRNYILKLV